MNTLQVKVTDAIHPPSYPFIKLLLTEFDIGLVSGLVFCVHWLGSNWLGSN